MIGSLCHFALKPTLLYDENLELLLQVHAALASANINLEADHPSCWQAGGNVREVPQS